MILLFNKKLITVTIVTLSLGLMIGCSNTNKPISDNNSINKNEVSNANSDVNTDKPSSPTSSTQSAENNSSKTEQ